MINRTACRFALLSVPAILSLPVSAWAAEAADGATGPTIVVTGQQTPYLIDSAAATRTGTPLIDTPQSVTTLSRQQLDDQAVGQLNDALRYVPGVILSQGEGQRDQVVLRGQSSTADFFLDGLRDDAQYYRPLYNTERVEVLKGANALLFGRGGGGGVINRVSKTADPANTIRTVSAGADTWGAWSLHADVNQPLSGDVALRVNGTYEALRNHRDVYTGHFIGVAPTLGANLGPATTLTLAYEYVEDRRVTDRGVPSRGGVPITGYDRTFFGSPTLNRSAVTAHLVRARIAHELSDSLSLNVTGLYATYDKFYANILPGVTTPTTVSLSGYDSSNARENLLGQVNLVWHGTTGALRHTLLAGIEGADQASAATRHNATFGAGATTSAIVPLAATLSLPAIGWTGLISSSRSKVRSLSAYLQDQIDLGDHVQIVLGARYDNYRISALNRLNQVVTAREDGKWSPRLGLILKPTATLSVYASYARSFLPQSGDQFNTLDPTYLALAPEQFRNLETGVKWAVNPGLAFTAAVFQVDRTGTRASDPVTGFPVLTGSSRVRGFEASLSGQITPQWRAILGYAYQQGEIRTTTTAAPAGRNLDKLPHHQVTAWTRYDLTPKLGLGLGLVHQSSQFASISNAVRLPGFTRLDAAVYYDFSQAFSLQLNVENLTDVRYFPSAHTDNNIATGEPLNARLTARMKF